MSPMTLESVCGNISEFSYRGPKMSKSIDYRGPKWLNKFLIIK